MSAAEIAAIARLAREAARRGERAMLAQLVAVEGSHYRRPGARMLLLERGEVVGAISGGCLEKDLLRRLPKMLAPGGARILEYDASAPEDPLWGLGTGCGGRIRVLLSPVGPELLQCLEAVASRLLSGRAARVATVLSASGQSDARIGDQRLLEGSQEPPAQWRELELFIETIGPPVSLLLCGAGPESAPLARLAQGLGWLIDVYLPRPGAMSGDALGPQLSAEGLAVWALRERSAAVVMTHNFLDDVDLLAELAHLPLGYLGLLGTRDRKERLIRELARRGDATGARLPRIHAPAGLDIGAERPEEIALSIAAEIEAVFSERPAGFLSGRTGRLHARFSRDEPKASCKGSAGIREG
jgi:xanthine dehydrogenase accessory factor